MKVKFRLLLFILPASLLVGAYGCQQFGNTEITWQRTISMEPTIRGGESKETADTVVVDRSAYTSSSLPKRADIVSFMPNAEFRKDAITRPLIKRIVALPGEKVEIKKDKLYINGEPLTEEYLQPKTTTVIDVCASSSTTPYLKQPQTIPDGSYLMMDDNRMNSYDGRCWGTIPRENILGKVTKVIKK